MTKSEKLQQRLLDIERVFTWQELRALLSLHKPHPGNELKRYVRRQLIEKLRSGGLIS